MRRLPVVCLIVAGLLSGVAQGQTAEQLRMLQSLPPAQQAELLETLTGDGQQTVQQRQPALPPLVMDRTLGSGEPQDLTPRVRPGATIVVRLSLDDELPRRELDTILEELPQRLSDMIGSSVHEIGRDGVLVIDAYYAIPLAGLTAAEAAVRIGAEPDFSPFEVQVTLLPLTETGPDSLERFGYKLFAGLPTSFAPATDIPVPADYVIGPGDTVRLQLFGAENALYTLVVNRDGVLQLPEAGPVVVAGMQFEQMRDELSRRLREQILGVEVSITLGELRSIRVFVLGDAQTPGSYTISGLSTITHALYLSGGVTEQGSLRNVQLKRNGRTVRSLDLYRLLLQGDTRDDLRLKPGDAVFVPPVGETVAISGEVVRPAIYELRGENTVGEVIELAGGLLPSAFPRQVSLQRIDSDAGRLVFDVDVSTRSGLTTAVRDGDILSVLPVLEVMDGAVELSGHVNRPGAREYRPGMRILDVLPDSEALRPQADLHYVLIAREQGPERRLGLISADLAAAWAGDAAANVPLAERDEIIAFGIDPGRAERIEPLLERLRLQSRSGDPSPEVRVGGRIVAAGDYPLEPGMRVSGLLRAGGGLQEAAYTLQAELARYDIVGGEALQTDLLSIDLAGVLAGEAGADLPLQSYDHLIIKEIPQWQDQESVELVGEVRFPGTYLLQRGETLTSVLERAGGLTDLAFAAGSVFVREELKRREQEQIENLASRLEADIVTFSLRSLQTDTDALQTLSIGQSLLEQLRQTRATGRLVIDVDDVVAHPGDPVYDIVMRDGDRLYIPEQTQEVTVLGEVQYATSHIFEPGLSRDDYISRSGGLTQKADRKRIYVVRANGAVLSGEGSRWFKRKNVEEIRTGDTIVVPLDADRIGSLALWTSISQIVYQLALAAASANAIGVF